MSTIDTFEALGDLTTANSNVLIGQKFLVISDGTNNGIYVVTGQNSSGTSATLEIAIGGSSGFDIRAVNSTGGNLDITSANTADNPLATKAYTDTEIGKIPSGVNVVATFPTSPAIGDQIFLDPPGNAIVVQDNHNSNRPRGLYAYIQPSSDPATRFWEELTIPEVGQLYNDARIGDVIYLTSDETNFNGNGVDHPAGFYRAASNAVVDSVNETTWDAVGGGSGSSVKVNDTDVANPNFETDTPTTPVGFEYSPPFQNKNGKVSVQIDTREIAIDIGLDALRAQVREIEEELSNPEDYVYSDDAATIYQTVFFTKRRNSTFTSAADVILQPHFEDNGNTFTTYAVLTDLEFAEWNAEQANDAIVGLGPNVSALIPFQIVSSIYRQIAADDNHLEIKLKMIGPDVTYTGQGGLPNATHRTQFESWARPTGTTQDPNPVVHQGISTYYYLITDNFLATVRHSLGNHITGSSLTPNEREVVDALVGVSVPANNGELVEVTSTTVDGETVYGYGTVAKYSRRYHGSGDAESNFPAATTPGLAEGDWYVNESTSAEQEYNAATSSWSLPHAIQGTAVDGLSIVDTASTNTLTLRPSEDNRSIVFEARPDPDETGGGARNISVERVLFNDGRVTNVGSIEGVSTGMALTNVDTITSNTTDYITMNGRRIYEDELFYLQVKEAGTFMNPPTLATALTGQAITDVTSSADDFTTAHKIHRTIEYYIRYQNYGTNQIRAILTTVADPNTALYVHNIT